MIQQALCPTIAIQKLVPMALKHLPYTQLLCFLANEKRIFIVHQSNEDYV